MRVTHVITRLIIGGAQENTVATVLGLRPKTNVTVRLISGPTIGPEGSLEPEFRESPELLTIVPSMVRPIHPLKDWIAVAKLTHLFRDQPPDIVHTHSGKAGILGRMAAHRARVPIIVHSIHGPSFGRFQGSIANLISLSAERYAARFTNHFVSVAEAMTNEYLKAGIGFPEQFTRIFSGFSLEPYLSIGNDSILRQKLGIAPADFVVGKIARLFELKGHEDLFAVAPALVKHCPQMKFLLIGDGIWRERFERIVQNLSLQNHFVFAGLVPPKDVPKYVGLMDVLVHLSRREGLPRALPQALAAARPVVAYDCAGAKEVCLENETGFLVQPGDKPTFVRRLLQLANDAPLREHLGRRGQEFVKVRFPVDHMVEQIYLLYGRLLNQHLSAGPKNRAKDK
jgi:glycosyltransferase involved in cell wall biosynthesis